MLGKLAILTPQGRKIVASVAGGGIPKGLALCLVPFHEDDTDAEWSVTHVQSGKRLGPGFTLLQHARHCAEALAECADWTQPEIVLRADPKIGDTVRAALDAYCTALDNAER